MNDFGDSSVSICLSSPGRLQNSSTSVYFLHLVKWEDEHALQTSKVQTLLHFPLIIQKKISNETIVNLFLYSDYKESQANLSMGIPLYHYSETTSFMQQGYHQQEMLDGL